MRARAARRHRAAAHASVPRHRPPAVPTRASCSSSVASVSSRPTAASASRRRRSRSSNAPRGVLETARQRRRVLGRHRRQPVPSHSQLGDSIDGTGPREPLDLVDNRDAIRLLARERLLTLAAPPRAPLTLVDRLANGVAGRRRTAARAPRRPRRRPGTPPTPAEPRRATIDGFIRIRHRDERFSAMQQFDRALAVLRAHARRRSLVRRAAQPPRAHEASSGHGGRRPCSARAGRSPTAPPDRRCARGQTRPTSVCSAFNATLRISSGSVQSRQRAQPGVRRPARDD